MPLGPQGPGFSKQNPGPEADGQHMLFLCVWGVGGIIKPPLPRNLLWTRIPAASRPCVRCLSPPGFCAVSPCLQGGWKVEHHLRAELLVSSLRQTTLVESMFTSVSGAAVSGTGRSQGSVGGGSDPRRQCGRALDSGFWSQMAQV